MAKETTKAKATAKAGVKATKVVKKKKLKLTSPKVLVNIRSTYNNTIVSVCDYEGNVISQSSCGKVGFIGSKKSTAYAATKAGEDASTKAVTAGAKEAEVVIRGIGIGRQAAVKGIRSGGLRITLLTDKTPVPHGGCKPRRAPKK
jgi:small subunit ribosomal protein S11